jgi:hypothetical protein
MSKALDGTLLWPWVSLLYAPVCFLLMMSQFPIKEAIQAGFTQDPVVQNISQLVKCKLLSELKWKARVEIPDGTFLMGWFYNIHTASGD